MLQQLAESSAFGAVQAAQGPCSALQQIDGEPGEAGMDPSSSSSSSAGSAGGRGASPAAGFAVDYVLMARFQMQEQLQEFLACPPVAALLQVVWALLPQPVNVYRKGV